jgi:hypothetical protein
MPLDSLGYETSRSNREREPAPGYSNAIDPYDYESYSSLSAGCAGRVKNS